MLSSFDHVTSTSVRGVVAADDDDGRDEMMRFLPDDARWGMGMGETRTYVSSFRFDTKILSPVKPKYLHLYEWVFLFIHFCCCCGVARKKNIEKKKLEIIRKSSDSLWLYLNLNLSEFLLPSEWKKCLYKLSWKRAKKTDRHRRILKCDSLCIEVCVRLFFPQSQWFIVKILKCTVQ